jgi:5-methylcytosine-specific restriction endonuclease McrA
VYKRDYGICALCGFDSGAAISAYRLAVKAANGDVQVGLQAAEACLKTLQEAGFNLSLGEIKWLSTWQLWEADHIVPLIEGWDGELDNVRTLCVPCHRKETAALRKRLAQARKEAKP